ncbi:MAG TPA: lysylphosphatidylglycerol synthase transmembrane domain-containing protein [Gaiellaceae bacterium]|nr:lysylphosphatidylglycerol synthase transmembrane domain-containing protein [Gaiellaceae bacterium]
MITSLVSTAHAAWRSLAGVSVGLLVAAVVLHFAKLVSEARSWHGIVGHAHHPERVGFRITCGAFVSAIGANALLPARVGEALRVGLIRRRVPNSSAVTLAATIVLETGVEVVFGVVVIAAAAGGVRLGNSTSPAHTVTGLASHPITIAAAAAVLVTASGLAVRFRAHTRALLGRMAAGFAILRAPRAFGTQVLSWKLVAWTFRFATVYAFLLAFHIPATLWTAVAVVAAQNIAASIPLLPGNVGTQQAAIAVALSGVATSGSVLGFGIGMQAATAIFDIAAGAVALCLIVGGRDAFTLLRHLHLRVRQPVDLHA